MGGRGSSSDGGKGEASATQHALPTLSGSEKQVAWASQLRKSTVAILGKTRPKYVAELLTHTDAKYWIDNRYGLGPTNTEQRAIHQHLRDNKPS